MTTNPEQLRADIEVTRAGLSRNVDALAESVRPGNVARRQRDKVTSAVFGARDAVMGGADQAQSASGEVLHSTGEAISAAPQAVLQRSQGNPLAAGLIALGVGWLVGSIMPATRGERAAAQTLKETAAPLVAEASDMAKDSAANLQEPANQAAAQVKTAAADSLHTVKEEGSSSISDVKDSITGDAP